MKNKTIWTFGAVSLVFGSLAYFHMKKTRRGQKRQLALSILKSFNNRNEAQPSMELNQKLIRFNEEKDKIEIIDPLFFLVFLKSLNKKRKFVEFFEDIRKSRVNNLEESLGSCKGGTPSRADEVLGLLDWGQHYSSRLKKKFKRFCDDCQLSFGLVLDFLEAHPDYLLFMDILVLLEMNISANIEFGIKMGKYQEEKSKADLPKDISRKTRVFMRKVKAMPNDFRQSVILSNWLFGLDFVDPETLRNFKEIINRELKLPEFEPINTWVFCSATPDPKKQRFPEEVVDLLMEIIGQFDLLLLDQPQKRHLFQN